MFSAQNESFIDRFLAKAKMLLEANAKLKLLSRKEEANKRAFINDLEKIKNTQALDNKLNSLFELISELQLLLAPTIQRKISVIETNEIFLRSLKGNNEEKSTNAELNYHSKAITAVEDADTSQKSYVDVINSLETFNSDIKKDILAQGMIRIKKLINFQRFTDKERNKMGKSYSAELEKIMNSDDYVKTAIPFFKNLDDKIAEEISLQHSKEKQEMDLAAYNYSIGIIAKNLQGIKSFIFENPELTDIFNWATKTFTDLRNEGDTLFRNNPTQDKIDSFLYRLQVFSDSMRQALLKLTDVQEVAKQDLEIIFAAYPGFTDAISEWKNAVANFLEEQLREYKKECEALDTLKQVKECNVKDPDIESLKQHLEKLNIKRYATVAVFLDKKTGNFYLYNQPIKTEADKEKAREYQGKLEKTLDTRLIGFTARLGELSQLYLVRDAQDKKHSIQPFRSAQISPASAHMLEHIHNSLIYATGYNDPQKKWHRYEPLDYHVPSYESLSLDTYHPCFQVPLQVFNVTDQTVERLKDYIASEHISANCITGFINPQTGDYYIFSRILINSEMFIKNFKNTFQGQQFIQFSTASEWDNDGGFRVDKDAFSAYSSPEIAQLPAFLESAIYKASTSNPHAQYKPLQLRALSGSPDSPARTLARVGLHKVQNNESETNTNTSFNSMTLKK